MAGFMDKNCPLSCGRQDRACNIEQEDIEVSDAKAATVSAIAESIAQGTTV
jgi:hypothetical protein